MVKNLPAMQETPVRFLGREDPLEKGVATHFSILACRIPWTEETGRLQSKGSKSWTRMSDFNFHSEMVKDTEEPGVLQSMGSQRVGYNLVIKES